MHHNTKEDCNNFSPKGQFTSNTLPLMSRSSMKRPLSLSSEQEHTATEVREHHRNKGFRSRSKTIHADSFMRPFMNKDYQDPCGFFSSVTPSGSSASDRGKFNAMFEQNRRKNRSHTAGISLDKHKFSHIFDVEEMVLDVDEEDEEEEKDNNNNEQFEDILVDKQDDDRKGLAEPRTGIRNPSMFDFSSILGRHLPSKDSVVASVDANPKRYDRELNPTAALFASTKCKMNFRMAQCMANSASTKGAPSPTSTDCSPPSTSTLFGTVLPFVQSSSLNKPRPVELNNGQCDLLPSYKSSPADVCHDADQKHSSVDDELGCDAPINTESKSFAHAEATTIQPSNGTSSDLSLSKSLASNLVVDSLTCCQSPAPMPAQQSTANLVSAHIPTEAEKAQFQRSLDSATTLVFHRKSGLPLTSSPAPIRKSGTCFDFDSSLTSVNAIKKALFDKDSDGRDSFYPLRSRLSLSTPTTPSGLLGNFEESVLNGRLEPASIVNGFTAEIGASGSFCPKHKTLPVTVFFYTLQDTDKGEKMSSPYLGHINLGPKGYHVPRQGTVQVTLFNPNGTVVKMFVVRYNLSDMPPNSRTFLRQRTLFMPSDATEHHSDSRKWLRYLIHLRFQSSKSGRIRLHTDMRILVFRKHDLDVATLNGGVPYELRSFVQMPSNPKYSKNIKT